MGSEYDYLIWSPDDGSSARALRRHLSRGLAVLLTLWSLLCLPILTSGSVWTRELGAVFLVAAILIVVRLASGRVEVLDVAMIALAFWVAAQLQDRVPGAQAFALQVSQTIFLIAVVCTLRVVLAAGVYVLGLASNLYVIREAGHDIVVNAWCSSLVNIGFGLGCAGLVAGLVKASRAADELARRAAELESKTAQAAVEIEAVEAVRLVLHDDVITALRAVAELPADRVDQVRGACRRAVSAVKALETNR